MDRISISRLEKIYKYYPTGSCFGLLTLLQSTFAHVCSIFLQVKCIYDPAILLAVYVLITDAAIMRTTQIGNFFFFFLIHLSTIIYVLFKLQT
jgi:hypothetical protein